MLRSVKEMTGYVLQGVDGAIGKCKDFLFDGEHWTVRYMVADTGRWLPGRQVTIPSISLDEPDWTSKRFPVQLETRQIENAPAVEEHKPISRRAEERLLRHYSYGLYWLGSRTWGMADVPAALRREAEVGAVAVADRDVETSALRSVAEVLGYDIRALDGDVGHVEDFIVDTETWTLRYVVVDTRKWLPGRKVLLALDWIERIEWSKEAAEVNLPAERIKEGPEFDPAVPVNREQETRLYDYYGRPRYW